MLFHKFHNVLAILILQGVMGQGRKLVEGYVAELVSDLLDAGYFQTLTFLYRLDVNRWRGSESCQLLVENIVREPSEPGAG